MKIANNLRLWFAAGVSLSALSGAALAQGAPIIQPGAPGTAAKSIGAAEASDIADTSYSSYDVEFMQDMILHHQQAVDMAALVADRTNSKELGDIAGRINVSQADEIRFMRDWLTSPDGHRARPPDAGRARRPQGRI